MKKYIKPEFDAELFNFVDVITTNAKDEEGNKGRFLKDEVNNKKGDNYGSQDTSIYA